MKVIKISDQAYARVCQIASEHGTYLADALDLIVFKGVGTDAAKNQKSITKRTTKPKGDNSQTARGTSSGAAGKGRTSKALDPLRDDNPEWDEKSH